MDSNRSYTEELCVGFLSDIGNVREINEDYIGSYENDKFAIYIVADGMGGHNAGDVASKIAVESCVEYMKRNRYLDNMENLLKESIKYANNNIYVKAQNSEIMYGMGTTITACLIQDEEAIIANVGDSSCYVLTEREVKKVTKDHSLVQQLVDDGSITEEEAINHPNKNIITRALGTKKNVEIDTFRINIDQNKKVVLCTDGLSNEISREEMYNIISQNTNQKACDLLVELCKDKGGRDNISVIIFGGVQK